MPTSCPGSAMWVGSTKDLKPANLICARRNLVQADDIMRAILTQAGNLTK
jgi:hypothetical protein